MEVRLGVTLASRGSRPAGGKAPGQHGGFVVAVKQERGEGPRAGEKGSHEEEVSHRTLDCSGGGSGARQ